MLLLFFVRYRCCIYNNSTQLLCQFLEHLLPLRQILFDLPGCLSNVLLFLLQNLYFNFASHQVIFNADQILLLLNCITHEVESSVLEISLVQLKHFDSLTANHAFQVLYLLLQLL